MTHYISEMTGKQYLARVKEVPTVIIPTGACEIYGQHLPLGSDILVAKKVAEMLAGYVKFLIEKFIADGVKNFIFLTGHAGNVPIIDYAIKTHVRDLHHDVSLSGACGYGFV